MGHFQLPRGCLPRGSRGSFFGGVSLPAGGYRKQDERQNCWTTNE
jgi:hypothetical protein